jgi:N6-adenosine-specific RNA methylase IME4
MAAVEEQTILSIDVIRTDGGTQPRAEVDQDVIRDYAQQMFEGVQFPPVTIFYDGTDYWLADGFHRYYAAKQQCKDIIYADVRQGTRRDAVLFSVGANATHGLRRTNNDKRRAVETLLNDPEWAKWSDAEIARYCAVSAMTVGRIKKELIYNNVIDAPSAKLVERNGTIYTMNTTNIGQPIPQPMTTTDIFESDYAEEEDTSVDTEPELPAWTPTHYEVPTWSPTLPPSPAPTPMPTPTYTPYIEDRQREQEREERRAQIKERLDQLRENGANLPKGKYSCLVIDPPWPMQKIERDVRPNQMEFDYPTMSEEELKDFNVPEVAADNCHLYLWTTHKYLPMAFRLAEHWGFKYQCLMTWRKNVGFTPFSWMYSTEHVLFCTKGNLPLLAIGKRLDFEAKVREHSRKPDEFYDLVRAVSPGPRLDIFSREKREDFDQFGNEVDKYDG